MLLIKLFVILALLFPCLLSSTSYGQVQEWQGPGILIEALAQEYHRPVWEIRRIVRKAYDLGHPTQFPTPIDILAVIGVESSFDPEALSRTGTGLMQINHRVHKVKNLKELSVNIAKGTELLSSYRLRSNSDVRALVYYNAGPGGASKVCHNPQKPCKTAYTRKIAGMKIKLKYYALKS